MACSSRKATIGKVVAVYLRIPAVCNRQQQYCGSEGCQMSTNAAVHTEASCVQTGSGRNLPVDQCWCTCSWYCQAGHTLQQRSHHDHHNIKSHQMPPADVDAWLPYPGFSHSIGTQHARCCFIASCCYTNTARLRLQPSQLGHSVTTSITSKPCGNTAALTRG